MENQEAFQVACKNFMRYLRKLKLKEKQTILELGRSSMRVRMFRTDNLLQLLQDEKTVSKLVEIFADTRIGFKGLEDLPKLLDTLATNRIIMKLDRVPGKLPNQKLLRWPKKMKPSNVR